LANDLQADILRCPACVALSPDLSPDEAAYWTHVAHQAATDPGQLELVDDRWLVCRDCGRRYPIRGGPGATARIPVLLIDRADQNRAERPGR
jgi:uncharacterized protein YbaR (Trm112 family)